MAPRSMSLVAHPAPAELLLTHAGALRSMARALLHDEHAADDVVQDTWVRALVATPSTDRGLGGWLQRVAEGFAKKHRRSEGRRAERERHYAAERREVLDTEQRSAVLRAVFEAVLALDEPYRETVLLRWFEGLPPRDIAERLGVRVTTVDSRLQRAHAQLRVTLERELGRERGGWRGVVALALGAPREAGFAPTFVLPLIGVAVGLKLAVGGVAVLVGLCFWLAVSPSNSEPIAPPPIVAAAAADKATVSLTAAEETHRRELAAGADDAGDSASQPSTPTANSAVLGPGPFEFELRVEVVDADERPQSGADVFLGPASCSTAQLGSTGWDGVLTTKWRGFEPEFRGVLSVRSGGQGSSLRRVLVRSGAPSASRFQLDMHSPAQSFVVRGVDASNGVFGSIQLTPSHTDEFSIDAAGNGIFGDSKLAVELNPDGTSSSGHLLRFSEPSAFSAIAAVKNTFSSLELDVIRADRLASMVEQPLPATVRGIVRDENGRPIHDLVVSGRTPHGWNTGVTCNSDGEFIFPPVPAGTAEFSVGGGERVFVHERVELAPGETRFLVLQPARRQLLRVRLTDPRESPLTAWRIEARSALDGSLVGVATTGEDGAACIGLHRSERVLLYARPAQSSGDPIVPVGASDFMQDSLLELRAPDEMRRGTIELTIDDPFAGTVEARAWRVDSDEGMALEDLAVHVASVPGRHKLTPRFLPGRWRVEVRAVGRAWTPIGECRVEPDGAFDFGLVTLPPLAELELRARDEKPAPARVGLRALIDGAIVTWAERDVTLPRKVQTRSDAPMEILLGAAAGEKSTSEMRLAEPHPSLLPIGRPRVVEFP